MKKKGAIRFACLLAKAIKVRKNLAALKWIAILTFSLFAIVGCGAGGRVTNKQPADVFEGFDEKLKVRMGCLASPSIGTRFTEPELLGRHGYKNRSSEKNGIVYTCRAGHIDIAHLRNNADWTAYFAALLYKRLMNNETSIKFKAEGASRYFVELSYPAYWGQLTQKEKEAITDEVSIRLGQYFAYTASIWHEVLTWFGYKSTGFYPEFQSAFSWEDTFSDLLGTHIGAQAFRDRAHIYDRAVTLLLDQELEELGVRSRETAKAASGKLKGKWFSNGLVFVNMKKRNFDVGITDGYITPLTLPYGCKSGNCEAHKLAVPAIDFLADFGFSMKFEIEPREWEKSKILKIAYPNEKTRRKRIDPAVHLSLIMEYIRQSAEKQYEREVHTSKLR